MNKVFPLHEVLGLDDKPTGEVRYFCSDECRILREQDLDSHYEYTNDVRPTPTRNEKCDACGVELEQKNMGVLTEGPYRYYAKQKGNDDEFIIVSEKHNPRDYPEYVALVYGNNGGEATAKLLAAAYVLEDALRDLLDDVENVCDFAPYEFENPECPMHKTVMAARDALIASGGSRR